MSRLMPAERIFGLSLIWQEAHYNFAYWDRIPEVDWDAAYREFLPLVADAKDPCAYYDLLARFVALLGDGHTLVIPPRDLHDARDRPQVALMRVEGRPVVTNTSCAIAGSLPVGSVLQAVNGVSADAYLNDHVLPGVCDTTAHRRFDHATARLLLGKRDTHVRCTFRTPAGEDVSLELLRNRKSSGQRWVREKRVPDPWEFSYFDAWFYDKSASLGTEFRLLPGNVAYMALHSFLDVAVAQAFHDRLPVLQTCRALILDLRRNHGGNDDVGFDIVEHLMAHATAPLRVQTQQHIALVRARSANHEGVSTEQAAALPEPARTQWLCRHHRWMREEDWGSLVPSEERLTIPVVLLTGSETGSAAEDFIMTLDSGGGHAVRIGQGTAGSSGQPLMESLPGGGMLGICTVRMPWPSEVYEHGIAPHIAVAPTIDDVIHDRDPVLAAAVDQAISTQLG